MFARLRRLAVRGARVALGVNLAALLLHLVAWVVGDPAPWPVVLMNCEVALGAAWLIGSDAFLRHAAARGWKLVQWVPAQWSGSR
jgi:hypothetical protein